MLINSRQQREKVSELLDQWSEWAYKENRSAVNGLGIRSWLGDIVKNNTHEVGDSGKKGAVIEKTLHEMKMNLVDQTVKSLPSLHRETVVFEYLSSRKERRQIIDRWLARNDRNYGSHRKMLSNVKDLLWLSISKSLSDKGFKL